MELMCQLKMVEDSEDGLGNFHEEGVLSEAMLADRERALDGLDDPYNQERGMKGECSAKGEGGGFFWSCGTGAGRPASVVQPRGAAVHGQGLSSVAVSDGVGDSGPCNAASLGVARGGAGLPDRGCCQWIGI